MVSLRCKMVVTEELKKIGFHSATVGLGEAEINEEISAQHYNQIRQALERSGFELLEDRKSILIQKIKNVIIDIVHYSEEPLVHNLSVYLSARLDYDYIYLSNLFSEQTGVTIEKFYIHHKIERVKELLTYEELTLTEIALKLHYCSVAHLSNQFKKVTGLSPTGFKKRKDKTRSFLEDI
jgi:YesN/AraC family two-component response regulator